MKIKIFGAGMAGCFLGKKIQEYNEENNRKIDFEIFDIRSKPNCSCAWGLVITKYLKKSGIFDNYFKEYILVHPKKMIINGVSKRINHITIFNKKKWLNHMWDELGVKTIVKPDVQNCDVVVDATGVRRALLPKCDSDRIATTYQQMIFDPFHDEKTIYIYMNKYGYGWAFPLGGNKWHIGAGAFKEDEVIRLFNNVREYYEFCDNCKCSCKGEVRCVPLGSIPIYRDNVVGVGESIGLVTLLGEGNTPAIESSDILFSFLSLCDEYKINPESVFKSYQDALFEFYSWQPKQYKFYETFLKSRIRAVPKLIEYITDYNKRVGDYCSMNDLLKMVYLYFKI